MEGILKILVSKYNYWIYIFLMMMGLYGMIAKKNLIKKIVGMNILQSAIILFFISTGAKKGATIPIMIHNGGTGSAADHLSHYQYINPLPHVLMLTAIVVAVSTLGVALALAVKVYRAYGTLEEQEIIERLKEGA
jgi:multicomponent Na+:H+ antiporter subunit C